MSARDIPRRLFLGSAAGALAFRPSHTAQADTTFTNFRFAATGAPAARTMPDRLSDIVNVKDWGALGNGLTNDESSIQNAIDYVAGKGGGRVFFPTGTYNLKGPNHHLKVGWSSDVRIELIGTGKFSCRIIGPATGATISAGGRPFDAIAHIEGFNILSSGASGNGCIKVTRDTVAIIDVQCSGGSFGIDASQANNVFIADCAGSGPSPNPAANANPGPIRGTTCIVTV
jgi:hypothetical protein